MDPESQNGPCEEEIIYCPCRASNSESSVVHPAARGQLGYILSSGRDSCEYDRVQTSRPAVGTIPQPVDNRGTFSAVAEIPVSTTESRRPDQHWEPSCSPWTIGVHSQQWRRFLSVRRSPDVQTSSGNQPEGRGEDVYILSSL
jgi:hypothetical protein